MCVGLTIMSCFIFKSVDESLHFAWIYSYFKDAITFENILEYLILNFLIKLVYFKKSHGNISLFLVQIYFTSCFVIISLILFIFNIFYIPHQSMNLK